MQHLHARAPMALAVAIALGHMAEAGAQQQTARLADVVVVAPTPLPGVGQPKNEIPAAVQTATDKDLERTHSPDISDYLRRSAAGVFVNDIQNNPFQPDVNYRGFTASPLLGTPQGISLYMDGVRLNQPFGDVVSWDLIPKSAIRSLALMPGSNPLFGLNTLGGAISLTTKDGRSAPGTALDVNYGSHARRSATLEHGGSNEAGFHWFVTGTQFRDNGWRVESPSDVGQVFAKLGWGDERTDVSLTAAHANSNLNGNGLQDVRLLASDYRGVYTKPDNTRNSQNLLNLALSHAVSDSFTLSGNAYYRDIGTRTYNGDINEDSLGESLYQPNAAERTALTNAGYTGFPTRGENASNTPFPFWRCIANSLTNGEPNEKCNGLINRTSTTQTQFGANLQASWTAPLAGHENRFTVGGGYDGSRVAFTQSSEFGYLVPGRGVVGTGVFADGTQDSENAFDSRVDLTGTAHTWSVYGTDTFAVTDALRVTASARYNRTRVSNHDNLTPRGEDGSLDAVHSFQRVNPALGLTWTPERAFGAYAGVTEGSRAPSAIELGCADPANPCRLPNAMAGDPPLKQVVTRTIEAGLRGQFDRSLEWNAGVFRAVNRDDIQFVADDQAGFGYFRNFGKTRRQGVELGLNGRASDSVSWGANYSYIDATYQSAETFNGEANGSNSGVLEGEPGFDGTISVKPGDRMPLIPRHLFKAWADWRVLPTVRIGLDMNVVGDSLARGNENGQHQADGVYYLGPGKVGGYAVLNLGADWQATRAVKFYAQVNNLFDRKYATAAQLGATGFRGDGSFIGRPFTTPVIDGERPLMHSTFVAPGAPRIFWIGARIEFGRS
ncbi:TonB-dependent receptor [Derxia gummosa]|uniref:TonB-dependent receptor n=1 Tax=Derxia gummosa DSM 723 TaxID=1121388 RepID=A0A9U5CRJ9_9BURK|nr:TonB-dependent receptor [Derxia gummosa]